jgi:membrane protein YqaA with SNARE-associated domain
VDFAILLHTLEISPCFNPLLDLRALPCSARTQAKQDTKQAVMLQRLYNWTTAMAEHPHALWVLAIVAFMESSVFPIPPDVIMIPMILARPNRAFLIAGIALAASVVGGLLGYAIGALAFETIGQPILATLGKADAMAQFNDRFNDLGFWAVLTAGVTPFPYKVITIMSGWTGMPLGTFIATSILARALRFFIVAALLRTFGAPIRDFIERRLGLMFILLIVLLVGGVVAVKFL